MKQNLIVSFYKLTAPLFPFQLCMVRNCYFNFLRMMKQAVIFPITVDIITSINTYVASILGLIIDEGMSLTDQYDMIVPMSVHHYRY